MRINTVEFDEHNEEHATRHGVTLVEIVQVFANGPEVRRNRRGRAAGFLASSVTDGGSILRVAFDHDPETDTARPIAAWRIT